jgi:hypothetical protein
VGEPLITEDEAEASWPGFADLDADERASLLLAATAAVEAAIGRTIGLATHAAERHRPEATRKIYLHHYPVASIATIEYGRAGSRVAISTDDYELTPATGEVELFRDYAGGYRYPDRTWAGDPRAGDVLVTYTAGYATAEVPPDIKRAALISIRGMNQSVNAGAYASEQIGAYSYRIAAESFTTSSGSGLPSTAAALVARYRRHRLA